jgi:TRAP-type C4-dicarboxylate transport system permease large subunit
MYISFSILLLRKAILISLYLINYLLAVAYIINARASIRDIINIYIWSKLISSRWRKSLAIYLFLNIIWNLNSGPFNSFDLIIFISKIYLFLIAFLLSRKWHLKLSTDNIFNDKYVVCVCKKAWYSILGIRGDFS